MPPSASQYVANQRLKVIEPDQEWKERLRRQIKENMRPMEEEARATYEKQVQEAPNNREKYWAEYQDTLKTLSLLSDVQFDADIEHERQRWRWAAGLEVDSEWMRALQAEQGVISDLIKEEGKTWTQRRGPRTYTQEVLSESEEEKDRKEMERERARQEQVKAEYERLEAEWRKAEERQRLERERQGGQPGRHSKEGSEENERRERADMEHEKLERVWLELELERLERERKEKLEKQRLERERLEEEERLEREKLEQGRQRRERRERERLQREKERLERERLDRERERMERERLMQEVERERERAAKERMEHGRKDALLREEQERKNRETEVMLKELEEARLRAVEATESKQLAEAQAAELGRRLDNAHRLSQEAADKHTEASRQHLEALKLQQQAQQKEAATRQKELEILRKEKELKERENLLLKQEELKRQQENILNPDRLRGRQEQILTRPNPPQISTIRDLRPPIMRPVSASPSSVQHSTASAWRPIPRPGFKTANPRAASTAPSGSKVSPIPIVRPTAIKPRSFSVGSEGSGNVTAPPATRPVPPTIASEEWAKRQAEFADEQREKFLKQQQVPYNMQQRDEAADTVAVTLTQNRNFEDKGVNEWKKHEEPVRLAQQEQRPEKGRRSDARYGLDKERELAQERRRRKEAPRTGERSSHKLLLMLQAAASADLKRKQAEEESLEALRNQETPSATLDGGHQTEHSATLPIELHNAWKEGTTDHSQVTQNTQAKKEAGARLEYGKKSSRSPSPASSSPTTSLTSFPSTAFSLAPSVPSSLPSYNTINALFFDAFNEHEDSDFCLPDVDAQTDFERFKLETRFTKIVEYHRLAAEIELEFALELAKFHLIAQQASSAKAEDINEKVAALKPRHETALKELQMRKEEERKEIVQEERRRLETLANQKQRAGWKKAGVHRGNEPNRMRRGPEWLEEYRNSEVTFDVQMPSLGGMFSQLKEQAPASSKSPVPPGMGATRTEIPDRRGWEKPRPVVVEDVSDEEDEVPDGYYLSPTHRSILSPNPNAFRHLPNLDTS